jgi:DNA-binding transcriptional LysR family regulator
MKASLDDLQLFCRIVELGSLRAAGDEQGFDPSSVTRRLAALEERLGVLLVTRSRVRSSPTEEGQRYYSKVKSLLDELAAVEGDLVNAATRPQGLLRVAAPTVFGSRHVGPWLHELQLRAPGIVIELVLCDHALDLVEQGIDLALRIGPLSDSSLISVRLGTMSSAIVASPNYVKQAGLPLTVADLDHHQFVLHAGPLQGSTLELSGPRGRQITVECRSRFSVSTILGVREAVLSGAGLNAGPLWLYADDIAAGRLVHVLPAFSPPGFQLHALMLPGRYRPAKISAALELLREKLPQLTGILTRETS